MSLETTIYGLQTIKRQCELFAEQCKIHIEIHCTDKCGSAKTYWKRRLKLMNYRILLIENLLLTFNINQHEHSNSN